MKTIGNDLWKNGILKVIPQLKNTSDNNTEHFVHHGLRQTGFKSTKNPGHFGLTFAVIKSERIDQNFFSCTIENGDNNRILSVSLDLFTIY